MRTMNKHMPDPSPPTYCNKKTKKYIDVIIIHSYVTIPTFRVPHFDEHVQEILKGHGTCEHVAPVGDVGVDHLGIHAEVALGPTRCTHGPAPLLADLRPRHGARVDVPRRRRRQRRRHPRRGGRRRRLRRGRGGGGGGGGGGGRGHRGRRGGVRRQL